jgi:hypothetical protein
MSSYSKFYIITFLPRITYVHTMVEPTTLRYSNNHRTKQTIFQLYPSYVHTPLNNSQKNEGLQLQS